jgi:hypothetical protein
MPHTDIQVARLASSPGVRRMLVLRTARKDPLEIELAMDDATAPEIEDTDAISAGELHVATWQVKTCVTAYSICHGEDCN